MPFDLVIDQETSWGEEVRVSQTSVCGDWGVVTGEIRYFSDRFGRVRGSIEGTQIPYDLIWEHAKLSESELVYDPGERRVPLRQRSTRKYQGFELDSEERGVDEFPQGMEETARRALAEAMAAGAAYHRDSKPNRGVYRELREVYRRSGGTTREMTESTLAGYFLERLAGVRSYSEFMETDLAIDPDAWVPAAERQRWLALPSTVRIQGEEYPLDYGVEDGQGLVSVRIPEKLLWGLTETDIPEVDRPLHWTVLRGKREAIRGSSLEEARELASRPRAELRREGKLSEERPLRGDRPKRSGKRRGPPADKGRAAGGEKKPGGPRKSESSSESRGNRRRHRGRDSRRRG
jgi:hypothetical protein